jgi:hypothetical protein
MKMEKKKLFIATATSILILITIFSPMLITEAVDPSDWYTTKAGVLDSDYYLLYPYAKKSVNIGFSKFGELIGIGSTANQSIQSNWVGMEYDGRDPFTPYDTIPMSSWINGWYIHIEYINPTATNKDRKLYAFAMFADGSEWGGDWKYVAVPSGEPHGGRKTNGTCTTDALKILYNGPRRFIAQSVTHISDKEGANTWPVLDLTITIIFNKDKKEVILLKDVKITIAKMKLHDKLNVQLSNREEYDLGPSTGYSSYAHYYEQEGSTCYGPDWHMAKNLTRDYEQHVTSYAGQKIFALNPPSGEPIASGFLKVYDDGVFVNPAITPAPYSVNWANKSVHFTAAPGTGSDMAFHYKYIFKSDIVRGQVPSWDHKYDIAQVLSSDAKYVAWAAIWPPASDYTVDGILRFLSPLSQCREADMSYEPKQSPLIIGEWDFLLDHSTMAMFRGVEVKGIADRHDGNDYQYGGSNVIDREVRYQLDEIFQPWDLYDAIHKQEYRWLYKSTVASHTNQIQLTSGLADKLYYCLLSSEYIYSLGASAPTWTKYFIREEDRVNDPYPAESKWVNEFQNGSTYAAHSKNWALYMVGGNYGEMLKVTPIYARNDTPATTTPLTLQLQDLVDFGFWYKRLTGSQGPIIEIKLYQNPDGTGNWANIAPRSDNTVISAGWHHYTLNTIDDYIGPYTPDAAFYLTGQSGTGLPTNEFHSFEYWSSTLLRNYYVGHVGVKIQINCTALVDDLSVAYLQRPSGIRYERVYNMEEDKLIPCAWDAYCTFAEKVLVDGSLIARYGYQDYDPTPAGAGVHRPYYSMNFINGTLKFYEWSTGLGRYVDSDLYGKKAKVLYSTIEENEKGAYEWTVLGRDAHTSDSLGAALVTAALKNKDIEIGTSAMEMMYLDWSFSSIPYVLNRFGTSIPGTRTDYKDDGSTPGQRPALKDDWCTTIPISSSNMITVGGPLANLLTLYFNEFTDAFWGSNTWIYGETYTPFETWQDKIVALTCWNGTKKGYAADVDTGYAVIATYKDLNGTVGLSIWGIGPRDTFYASKFFHEEIIYELQNFPLCVTSIILKIEYADPQHPTFTIAECLGTISERRVETTKGGIHDP